MWDGSDKPVVGDDRGDVAPAVVGAVDSLTAVARAAPRTRMSSPQPSP